ncbi:hypothetical protein JCM10296v2_005829 [Rhodotorula toruloides]
MLLMHIDNYAPYAKSWSSFVSDAGLDFVLLRRFVNLISLDLTFEDYVDSSFIANLLPRLKHLVSLHIASVAPDDGYGRMRLADYSLCDSSKVVAMASCFPDAVRLLLSQSRSVDYAYDDYPLDTQGNQFALLLQGLRATQIVHLRVSKPDGIAEWWRTSSEEDFVV